MWLFRHDNPKRLYLNVLFLYANLWKFLGQKGTIKFNSLLSFPCAQMCFSVFFLVHLYSAGIEHFLLFLSCQVKWIPSSGYGGSQVCGALSCLSTMLLLSRQQFCHPRGGQDAQVSLCLPCPNHSYLLASPGLSTPFLWVQGRCISQ